MILVDTLRADYLGMYGFEGNVSPHLDRLAKSAVVFRNCFSQAPWTKPSIASLFTSLQVPVHQVESHDGKFGSRVARGMTDTLAAEAVTLAEVLKNGGYATAAFVVNPWISVRHGFGQGFDVFDTESKGNGVKGDPVLAAAAKWIEAQPPTQPYFAYIHLMDVHGPYNAPQADYEAVQDSPGLGQSRELTRSEFVGIPGYLRRARWVDARGRDLRIWRGRYAAQVHAMDRRVGGFVKQLRALGALDRAVFVITSDHGEQLFEHGQWDHGYSLYDEELHVPLIIRLPGAQAGGHSVEQGVSLVDVMPTLIGLAGLPAVDGLQGKDLGPLLQGDDGESLPSYASAVKNKPTLQSARTDSHKLIRDTQTGERQLYDLEEDPGERQVVDDAAALARMEAVLAEQAERNRARGKLAPGRGRLSEVVRERLRALGYEEMHPPTSRAETPSP
jgi:arylsulfatase A-like enzyme